MPEMDKSFSSIVARSTQESDYTAVAHVTGLQVDTRYCYSVVVNDGPPCRFDHQVFRTFPSSGIGAKFQIAFGAGAGFVPENERI